VPGAKGAYPLPKPVASTVARTLIMEGRAGEGDPASFMGWIIS
jgi:hypothetical protein